MFEGVVLYVVVIVKAIIFLSLIGFCLYFVWVIFALLFGLFEITTEKIDNNRTNKIIEQELIQNERNKEFRKSLDYYDENGEEVFFQDIEPCDEEGIDPFFPDLDDDIEK